MLPKARLLALSLALLGQPAIANPLSANPGPAAVAVRDALSAILSTVPAQARVGLVVLDTHNGETWFARDAQQPLKPASVMKLFVTAAALERFGPDFTFKTKLYVRDDELLVLGGGDPALGDERIAGRRGDVHQHEFSRWARRLRERGLTRLATIAVDDTIFDRQHRHPDWPADQESAWYQAPLGGVNWNDNCLDASFTVAGGRVELSLVPDLPESFVRNTMRVAKKHAPVARRTPNEDVFEFLGPVRKSDRFRPISAARPTVFFGFALHQGLTARGITLSGPPVRRQFGSALLADAELLDTHTTPLRDVLWRCNTFSQNLFAECLLKSLAAYKPDGNPTGATGSWEAGVQVLETTLRALGLELDGAVFRDGSGLSHQNRVTAEQIARLLVIMSGHPQRQYYLKSLAEPGQEGTMRRRYDTPALRGRLRGKTGTISGVRTLAGYVRRSDGQDLVFALLVNGNAPRALPKRVAEALATAGLAPQP
jgi:D-alanyl-D-alanine carboxypeptidase/D-alanyl-D-alanine-endopeptidase (penicillin-binding protein 4)